MRIDFQFWSTFLPLLSKIDKIYLLCNFSRIERMHKMKCSHPKCLVLPKYFFIYQIMKGASTYVIPWFSSFPHNSQSWVYNAIFSWLSFVLLVILWNSNVSTVLTSSVKCKFKILHLSSRGANNVCDDWKLSYHFAIHVTNKLTKTKNTFALWNQFSLLYCWLLSFQ